MMKYCCDVRFIETFEADNEIADLSELMKSNMQEILNGRNRNR